MEATKTPVKCRGFSKFAGQVRLVEVHGNCVHLEVCGSVTVDDAADCAAIAEVIGGAPVSNILLELRGDAGWDPCALVQRIWTAADKQYRFAKLAIVCNSLMQHLMAEAAKPLFSDRIRVFDFSERLLALDWLRSPQLIPASLQAHQFGFRHS